MPTRDAGELRLTCYLNSNDSSRDSGIVRLYLKNIRAHLMKLGVRTLSANIGDKSELMVRLLKIRREADFLVYVYIPSGLDMSYDALLLGLFSRDSRIFPIALRDFQAPLPKLFSVNMQFFLERGESALRRGQPSEELLNELSRFISSVPQRLLRKPPRKKPAPTLRSLNEGKLILVGRGEVGKTSLVRRLVADGFDGQESKTQGIDITKWLLPQDDHSIRLNIWDFGGQEIMHATHQFFLTERSLYLLVLNGRQGAEDIDAEYWLKHIESFGGDSPIIVVQNKITQHPFELNYRSLRGRYPGIRGFVKTDCKDRMGIGDLHQLIQTVVASMVEVRMQFPDDWFSVKERLELMDNDYLDKQAFANLCAEEGIDSETDRDTLGFALHCLGIALNYRDDARLRETSVLKPEWVTQGIYNVLNAKTLADRQGELQLADLKQLLPAAKYPSEKHLFLLELMRKFSLCFPLMDEPDRYLIPELLGKEEPAAVATFRPEDCLNFEYQYGILPEGLLPRFIVRTHVLSRGQERWRSGVVLAYEGCMALVKAEPIERRVIVRVRGGDARARLNLLAIIRYDLDLIHAEFKDRLEAQAKVPLREFPAFAVDYRKLVAFERQGVKEFLEYLGDRIVTVGVLDLLNGVDFTEELNDHRDARRYPKSVFFSYAHEDEVLRDELETHLKLLQRQGLISTWHDRKIPLGGNWDREIDRSLEQADLVLLLVSADFVASDYCWDNEVKRALERHAAKETTVVPILLRPCDWRKAPFSNLQGLPTDMIAVTAWANRDAAWTDVASGVRAIAERPNR